MSPEFSENIAETQPKPPPSLGFITEMIDLIEEQTTNKDTHKTDLESRNTSQYQINRSADRVLNALRVANPSARAALQVYLGTLDPYMETRVLAEIEKARDRKKRIPHQKGK